MKHLIWLVFLFTAAIEAKTYQLLETKLLTGDVVERIDQDNKITVRFLIPSLETTEDKSYGILSDEFSTIKINGMENTKEVSRASLPYYSFIVKGAPGDFKVNLKKGKAFTIKGLKPTPARELPCRCAKDKNVDPNINIFKYEEGRGLYSVEYLGDFRGEHLSKVTISPTKYRNSRFEVYPKMQLTLSKTKGGALKFSDHDIEKKVANNKNYLMVAASHLVGATQKMAAYKRTQGFKVKVVDLATIGKSSSKLKAFLHEEYKRNGYNYSLLVGHENNMPTEYINTSNDAETPSDLKYFTMGGANDLIPDVFYGRIVAESAAEVLRQLKKTKEYDTRSYRDNRGRNHFVGVASDEGSDPTDVEYMQGYAKEFQDIFGTQASFFFQENSNSSATNINKALNQGASWFSYIGHGSGDTWSSVNRGDYNSRSIKKLKAGIVKPIIIDVACQNGRFSYEGRLGERFMNESKNGEPIGAVAYYGGSVDVSWHPPAIMARGINQAIAKDSSNSLGEAILKGQLYLLANYDDREAAEENLVWYHLFGDPSLKVSFK